MLFLVVYTIVYALPYLEMKREAHRPGAIPAQMPGFLDETVIESVTLESHEQQMKEKDDANARLREQLHEAEKAAELAKHSFPPARPPPARSARELQLEQNQLHLETRVMMLEGGDELRETKTALEAAKAQVRAFEVSQSLWEEESDGLRTQLYNATEENASLHRTIAEKKRRIRQAYG